jgi:3-hydroxymyristoyl/3-hydroxydecanoyl-(acyl carrier protein) dehydratase
VRYRFLDRILAHDARGAGTLRACKLFPASEDYFDGTFRSAREVPASLVLETMATAGSLLLAVRSEFLAHGILLKVARARFAHGVRSGDRLVVEAALTATQDVGGGEPGAPGAGMASVEVRARVEAAPVAEAELLFLSVPMVWSFGADCEREVTDLLELIGASDPRP